ncbi:hypothetical protein [Kitasatospora cathayae]|uniref:Glycerophosphoryl diester phosphodiesterase membrane domain-containing protein n=1 Tax=Kitasatospora cathayae TaxID=3004092 RepID=A0ABY7Q7Q6_9ACTN|nr:hypothetical protein [Kitasatospora sp. HUAS 3-15]WBP88597.1 hypothetical protein O1G21_23975 [Kitasatospora sp. HUAS 3-15]
MTDTPGWASPGSSEPPRDGVRPPADAPAAVPGPSAPPQATPGWGTQYGQPHHGGQTPGRGPYGWEAARSPRPGVIPLRPLSVGELLDGAVTTVRRHWRTALTLSLGIAVLDRAGAFVAQLLVRGRTGASTQLLTLLASLPLTLLLDALAVALLTIVVSRAVLGRSVTAGEAWRDARPRLLKLLGLTVLTTLLSGGVILLGFTPWLGYSAGGAGSRGTEGLLFLVGVLTVPVGLWLLIRYSLAAPALMLEKQGVVTALSRSRRLARGSWWRIFGIVLLSRLLAGIVGATLVIPFRVIGLLLGFGSVDRFGDTSQQSIGMMVLTAIAGIIASALATPFLAAVSVLVYIDQRIRREALDIELARAAGLPEQGGTGGSGPADQTTAGR